MPFRSRAQWAWAFATGQPFARRWAHETPGGKGARYRQLPRKKKSFADLLASFKADRGYSARAGETIRGRLTRGGDGKFTSGGSAAPAKPAAPKPKPTKTPKRPKLRRRRDESDQEYEARVEQASQERQAEGAQREQDQTNERQANREAVYHELGLFEDATASLTALFEGGDNTDDGGLAKMGLAEQNRDGTYRLTPAGRQFVRAAERGDAAQARDTLAAARDREAGQQERQTAADERKRATEQRRQEAAAKRQQREQERAKRQADAGKRRQERQRAPKRTERRAEAREATPPTRSTPVTSQARRDRLARALERLFGLRLGLAAAQTGKSTLTVFKDAKGDDRWLSVTTTAYQDRDGEWISRKAIEGAVQQGDATGERGPLRYWHVPGLDFGECDFQATAQDGRFLIESGTCKSPAHAAVVRKAAERGYQMSPGFVHSRQEPKAGVFNHIVIFERSFVPPGRASNPFTRLTTKGVRMLTAEKEAALKTLTGDPELLSTLLAQVEKTDKQAQERATYKDAPDWAQALLSRLDALEAREKAGPPPEVIEEKAPPPEMAEEEPLDEGDDTTAMMQEFANTVAQAVVAAIGPMLDIEKKMSGYVGELKTMMGSLGAAQAQKDAAAAEQAERLNAVEATVKELTGEPVSRKAPSGYRASQDDNTRVPKEKAAALAPAGFPDVSDPDAAFLSFITGAPA